MNLTTPLEIDVFWKNGDVCQLESLGISTSYTPETKKITFYTIDYISIGEPEGLGHEVGFIGIGSEEFATPYKYEELKSKVAECMN